MCAPLAWVLLHCFVVSAFPQQAGGRSKFLLAEPTLKSDGVDKKEYNSNVTEARSCRNSHGSGARWKLAPLIICLMNLKEKMNFSLLQFQIDKSFLLSNLSIEISGILHD